MIWPWFERFDAIKPYSNGIFAIPYHEQFPKLVRLSLVKLLSLYFNFFVFMFIA